MQPPKYLYGLVGALICVVPYLLLLNWSDSACTSDPLNPFRLPLLPCLPASYAFFFYLLPGMFLSSFPEPLRNFLHLVSAIPVASLGYSLAMKRYTVTIVAGVFILLCTVFGWGLMNAVR
jgi:hypothetical protein